MMKASEWLNGATKKLEKAGVATARLDCLVLLEDAFSKDRSYLLAHPNELINAKLLKNLNELVERRAKHEPLAYIRGKSEFYGREFIVNNHTLEPRPETETMIDLLKQMTTSQKLTDEKVLPFRVIDVGTGSGCIGITVKLEVPEVEVMAVDVSKECLAVARQNAKKLGADVEFYEGDLIEPVKNQKIDVMLCNLPYVPDKYQLNEAAKLEPKLAIFGGTDGLDLYRKLFMQIKEFDLIAKYILTESLPFQHEELAKIAKNHGYKLERTEDFIQVFKPTP